MSDIFYRPDHLMKEEIRTFADNIRKFVDKEVLPHESEFEEYWDWTEREEHTFVEDIFKKLLIDLGIQQTFVPPQYGGSGDWSGVEYASVVLEVARGDHGLAETGFISHWAVSSAMRPYPNDKMMKKIAQSLLGDEPYMICSAMTEPEGGGSVEDMRLKGSQIKTRARLMGDEWVINGHKLWPSAYREAKEFVVICAVEGEQFPNNIAQIMIPANLPGVSTSKPYEKMGTFIDTNGDVWFENVRVPKENRLHEGEDEVNSVIAKCTTGRASAGVFAIGVMRRAYEIFKFYVDNREIAGMPMKEHGVIAHELAEIASDIYAAESAVWSALERLDHPELYGPPWSHGQLTTTSLSQYVAGESAWKVVNRCLELMGSYGYSKEGKMEKLLRDIKVSQIVVGGPVLHLLEGARHYFGTETI
jgi:alkylation response protein AidB-like acyl-CoA dehydrogenase